SRPSPHALLTLSLHDALPISQNAQNAKPASASKATPRMPDGHPDLSGFYDRDIFHGDPNQELAVQHFINRASDGNIFYDYAGAKDRKSTRLNSSHLVISYAVF